MARLYKVKTKEEKCMFKDLHQKNAQKKENGAHLKSAKITLR